MVAVIGCRRHEIGRPGVYQCGNPLPSDFELINLIRCGQRIIEADTDDINPANRPATGIVQFSVAVYPTKPLDEG